MAIGKRKERQKGLWIAATDLPSGPRHPFYNRLRQLLDDHSFDAFVEQTCQKFYAAKQGRPSLPPGVYFRMLLIGSMEGLDSHRSIAWSVADSITLRRFAGIELDEPTPGHSTIARTRRLIDLETHEKVLTWVLGVLAKDSLRRGQSIGVDPARLESNGTRARILRRHTGKNYQEFLARLVEASGIETSSGKLFEGSQAESAIEATARELRSLEPDIERLASQLRISFPTHYQIELQGLLKLREAGTLDSVLLSQDLRRTLELAREDRAELQKARAICQAADTLFAEASQDVSKTGLMPLIRELDQLYRRLTSREAKSLLETRNWTDFHQLISSVTDEMKRLRGLTGKEFQEEEKGSRPAARQRKETDHEKALRILRLPPNAGFEHIQKAYRWLSTVWHPDSRIVKDDAEMKAINWAYEFLKKSRKGS